MTIEIPRPCRVPATCRISVAMRGAARSRSQAMDLISKIFAGILLTIAMTVRAEPANGPKSEAQSEFSGEREQDKAAVAKGILSKVKLAFKPYLGPNGIVSALQRHDFFVLLPINPSTLAKYRVAFKPSRAKDDPTHNDELKPIPLPGSHLPAKGS
jgi:hypothetical protein